MNLLTNEEADALLHMPKFIIVDDIKQTEFEFSFSEKIYGKYKMRSDDGNFTFLMQIQQSKLNVKITLHFQESSRPVGLLRIDYNAPDHKNPAVANEHVPDFAKPYTGQHIYGSHVHIHVEGYHALAWAVPISDYKFHTKEMCNIGNLYSAITEFCGIIGLQTAIKCEGRLFL